MIESSGWGQTSCACEAPMKHVQASRINVGPHERDCKLGFAICINTPSQVPHCGFADRVVKRPRYSSSCSVRGCLEGVDLRANLCKHGDVTESNGMGRDGHRALVSGALAVPDVAEIDHVVIPKR